jgi:hypothetical protein
MPVLNKRSDNQIAIGNTWQNLLPPDVEFVEKLPYNLALFENAPVDFNLLVWKVPKHMVCSYFFKLYEMLLLAFHNGPPAVLVVRACDLPDLEELVHNLNLKGGRLADSSIYVYHIPAGPRGLEKEKMSLELRNLYHKLLIKGCHSMFKQCNSAELKDQVQDFSEIDKVTYDWLNSLDW